MFVGSVEIYVLEQDYVGHDVTSFPAFRSTSPAYRVACSDECRMNPWRTSENTPSRDCLETSWTGRIACFLAVRSTQKGVVSHRCARSRDHEKEPSRSFQTVSLSTWVHKGKEEDRGCSRPWPF